MIESSSLPYLQSLWALTDDRPGNTTQVLGVCDQLGKGFQEKTIRFTGLERIPNSLRGASLLGVDLASRASLVAPWPDLVIAAGRRLAPVSRWIKRQSAGKTRIVQIMFSGKAGAEDFDLIIIPRHDDLSKAKNWKNVCYITGAPTRITSELLAREAEHWRSRYETLPRPYIAMLVGGATRKHPFSRSQAYDLGERIGFLARSCGGSPLVTTSPRTSNDIADILMQELPTPNSIHTWSSGSDNPYFGILGLADIIVVTGDSVSMCAEACATSKPVYIFAPPGSVSNKHERFHQQLFDLGCARPLGQRLDSWTHLPLHPATDIADAIRKMFHDIHVHG